MLTDIFMGAASTASQVPETKRKYVDKLLQDLLCTDDLPEDVRARILSFDPSKFDLQACADDFQRDPPMSKRRLLELAAYVTLADGEVAPDESRFIRNLGEALRMAESEYSDLLEGDPETTSRESFIELARVPVPYRG